ncbi:MAG: PEGA domain-containing protein [Verrucomicrobiota bacterium]
MLMRLRFLLITCLLFLGSCATIISGDSQKVAITSQPPGAQVKIDGTPSGLVTPAEADLVRRSSHQIELELKGYAPYITTLTPSFNPVALGNILIGGLIGIACDSSTGAINKFSPGKVDAVMQKK